MKCWLRRACVALLWLGFAAGARAEPYIAVQTGLKCSVCHVNPTGGGLRSVYGDVFAQTQMPATHLGNEDLWTGDVAKLVRMGADLRFDASATQVPHTRTVTQLQTEQARGYLELNLIPGRLQAYVDELVAPGNATNREAWVMYQSADHDWYVKAGQMYLPFGLRLQDTSALVDQVSGIDMTTPDQAIEFGFLHGHWDAQFDISNGTGGGTVTDSRKQYGGQLAWVDSVWRAGVAVDYDDQLIGARSTFGVFGGLHLGSVALLGEADSTDDRSVAAGQGQRRGLLGEADWLIVRGSNLKFTAEFLDPDHVVADNGQTRWSLVYECTPVQFAQLRLGVRYYDGIAQSDAQHTRLYFLELHGFL